MLRQGEAAYRTGPHRQPPRAQPVRRSDSKTARPHTRPRAALRALAATKPHLRANGDLADECFLFSPLWKLEMRENVSDEAGFPFLTFADPGSQRELGRTQRRSRCRRARQQRKRCWRG